MDVDTDGDGNCSDLEDTPPGARRFFYCQDANYNVVALRESTHSGSPPSETITNTIVERYEYDPYGTVRVVRGWDSGGGHEAGCVAGQSLKWLDASLPSNPVLYCGYLHDWETGADGVRNRVLNSRLGRWMQRDPAGDLVEVPQKDSRTGLIAEAMRRMGSLDVHSSAEVLFHTYLDGMSLYEYAMGMPTRGVDPLGLIVILPPPLLPPEPAACGTCGPKIDTVLFNMIVEIDVKFDGLLPWQKDCLCTGGDLKTKGYLLTFKWDSSLLKGSFVTDHCPSGKKCERYDKTGWWGKAGQSVTISGRCYGGDDVNYVLAGRVARNCDGWDRGWSAVRLYAFGQGPERLSQKSQWFVYGYNGDGPPDPPSCFSGCNGCTEEWKVSVL